MRRSKKQSLNQSDLASEFEEILSDETLRPPDDLGRYSAGLHLISPLVSPSNGESTNGEPITSYPSTGQAQTLSSTHFTDGASVGKTGPSTTSDITNSAASYGDPSTVVPSTRQVDPTITKEVANPERSQSGGISTGYPSTGIPSNGVARFRNKHSRGKGKLAYYVPGKPRWYQISVVQDALNNNERNLLQVMWQDAKGSNTNEKELKAGVHALAFRANMHPNNVRLLLKSLAEKHAIRIQKSEQRTGTPTYIVFSWTAILQRWKQLGFRYAIWNRGAATLTTGLESCPIEDTSIVGAPVVESPEELPTTGQVATPVKGRHQLSSNYKNNSSSSLPITATTGEPSISQAVAELRSVILQSVPQFDDAGISKLVKECRQAVPEITPAEILLLFKKYLPTSRGRGIKNQVGYLLWSIVENCSSESLEALRVGIREADSDDREYWEQLAANPDATEEMRRLAKEQLQLRKAAC